MRHFYKHLITGQSAGESLNHAMEWMRESDSYSAVKYWAPSVLIGDDVTLEFRHFRLGYNSKVARIAFMRFRVFFYQVRFFNVPWLSKSITYADDFSFFFFSDVRDGTDAKLTGCNSR